MKAFTLVLRLNIKSLPGFGGIRRLICQIQGWSQPQYQNLSSCLVCTQGKIYTHGWNLKEKIKIEPANLCFCGKHHTPIHHSGYTSLPRNSSTPSPTLLLHVTNKDTKSLSCERMKSTLLLT